MKKAPPGTNPVEYTYGPPNTGSTAHSIPHPEPISAVTHHIAGILVTVFGLNELAPATTDVAVLWLLHPRLQTEACMAPFAAHLITEWNQHSSRRRRHASSPPKGLIAVSFDQRNHGTRLVSEIANEAWRTGNEHHAQDMFSCFAGTAQDTSLLLDFLPGYIFPDGARRVVQNLVLGVSLGGHAAWHAVTQDPRIAAAIVVIGSPDYARVMADRARLSKRTHWLATQGRAFLGSPDFPPSLLAAVHKLDPAGLLWSGSGVLSSRPGQDHLDPHAELSPRDRDLLAPLMARCFAGKRILCLSGGSDKLVPYRHSKPFLDWLKASTGKGGWSEGTGLVLEDIVFEGVGHDVPPAMVDEMVRFTIETLDGGTDLATAKLDSKI